jgi:hypothetical protein
VRLREDDQSVSAVQVVCTVHTVNLVEDIPTVLPSIAPWTEPVVCDTARGVSRS